MGKLLLPGQFNPIALGITGVQRADFLFLLLTPTEIPRMQIQPIARIAALREGPYVWERILSATTPPEMLEAIRSSDELNTDCSKREPTADEIIAVVQAWQSAALSRDSMLDIFRRGEVLPEGRTNEEEVRLIARGKPEPQPQAEPAAV